MSGDAVFRHLPDVYRRAGGEGTVTWALLNTLGRRFAELDGQGAAVLVSRFFEQTGSLADAERLAGLFSLAPWPEESLEDFRFRVRQVVRTYLRGAATPRSILELVGAGCNAVLEPVSVVRVNNRTTRGEFRRRTGDGAFTAEVVDLPDILQREPVTPDSRWCWQIESRVYLDPGELNREPSLPEPIIDIAAGDRTLALPILVQRDVRRLILINRFMPPGAVLRIDLQQHRLQQISGPHCLMGPVRMNNASEPIDLLYGTGGIIGDPLANRLSGTSTRPFHLLRWSNVARVGPTIPEVPGPPGSRDPAPWFSMPMPPLLGWGISHWRLMLGVDARGRSPEPGEIWEDQHVRTVPCPAEGGPESVVFYLGGGQPGTFTVRFPEQYLSHEINPTAPKPHRARWLREQIDLARPAGVIYYDQKAPVLHGAMPGPAQADPVLRLWETVRSGDNLNRSVATVPRSLNLTETIAAGDAARSAAGEEESQ